MARTFRTFTALLQCKHCGGGLPLTGPMRTVRCAACLGDNAIKPERMASYIYYAVKKFDSIVDEMKWGYPDGQPCAACGKNLDLERATEADGVRCECGTLLPAYPPPPWLREQLPDLAMVYGGERDPADLPAGQTPLPPAKGAQPIVMACPSCKGALSVTSESARVMPCSFCNASVYLPDDLWRALHPVKRVQPWTIGFDSEYLLRLEDIRSRERERAEKVASPVPPATWLPGPKPRAPEPEPDPASDADFTRPRRGPAVLVVALLVVAALVTFFLVRR
jgi:hypothetical protein